MQLLMRVLSLSFQKMSVEVSQIENRIFTATPFHGLLTEMSQGCSHVSGNNNQTDRYTRNGNYVQLPLTNSDYKM